MGHIRMMAAVQPFLSGAISKTVNLPNKATVEDVQDAYMEAWKLGLKAIAIYRDGSKGQQVLTTTAEKNSDKTSVAGAKSAVPEAVISIPAAAAAPAAPAPEKIIEKVIEYRPLRRRLSDERKSITHKFSVGGHEGYITIGMYDDGAPGEMFIRMAKGGSVISGLMDSFATATSIALQYGVPLKVLVNKFVHVRFEPSGFTTHPNIRIAKSMVDYIFRWMAIKFLSPEDAIAAGANMDQPTVGDAGDRDLASSVATADPDPADASGMGTPVAATAGAAAASGMQLHLGDAAERSRGSNALTMSFDVQGDAPACDTCGAIMVRNAACYKCLNCGSTSGCS
ncbi:MAG: hypothetical protein RLZZ324_1240 [Candidatus Parcubacteria bacterium]|jgi:ribonucleoside-diphosphate reductase alpha chain